MNHLYCPLLVTFTANTMVLFVWFRKFLVGLKFWDSFWNLRLGMLVVESIKLVLVVGLEYGAPFGGTETDDDKDCSACKETESLKKFAFALICPGHLNNLSLVLLSLSLNLLENDAAAMTAAAENRSVVLLDIEHDLGRFSLSSMCLRVAVCSGEYGDKWENIT